MYYHRDLSSNVITSLPDKVFANQRGVAETVSWSKYLYNTKPSLHKQVFSRYDKKRIIHGGAKI